MWSKHQIRGHRHHWALLLIDWINDFAFDGSQTLIEAARPAALAASRLKQRALEADVPCIYVNDNFGRWRASFDDMLQHCRTGNLGADVFESLLPTDKDYFVLKPRHSGFFHTPLELLLDDLSVGTLVLTGLAGNICVLYTAHDAHMRDFRVVVAEDATASNTPEQNEFALRQIVEVVQGDVRRSDQISFPRGANVDPKPLEGG